MQDGLFMLRTLRAYVQQNGMALTTCPACNAVQTIRSDVCTTRGHSVGMRCSCGTGYTVVVESRKAYRRTTNLSGAYTARSSKNEEVQVLIQNMSMTGLAFTTKKNHTLRKGDELALRLTLDDETCTEIQAHVTIKHISGDFVGCSIKDISVEDDEALANYLMRIP